MKYKDLGTMLSKDEMKNVKGGYYLDPCAICNNRGGDAWYCSGGWSNYYTCTAHGVNAGQGCALIGQCFGEEA